MKLIIKEYLSSLRERDELDALLPDLLSQMGLHVFSRPGRGTRQYGVDIAAVGQLDGGPEKVYLLSVKSGNLGRSDWNSGSPQDLKPSLDDMIGVYIQTHLPPEYKNKPIQICICIGGDIMESVRLSITSYIDKYETETISIVEWDGDDLSSKIENHFLQEDLLPKGLRPLLRKALALLDEPEASFSHFSKLVKNLSEVGSVSDKQRLTSIRQMNLCLWILFAWSREADNLESSYLSAELTLLHAWDLNKNFFDKNTKVAKSIQLTFYTILKTYQDISHEYLSKKIIPYGNKKYCLSMAVSSSEYLDVNLKLFDVLGRLALAGVWSHWLSSGTTEKRAAHDRARELLSESLKGVIVNNPALFLPTKDDQAIDISLAVFSLLLIDDNESFIKEWLMEITDRSILSYDCHRSYPCIYHSYNELLDHPESRDQEYRENSTAASVLYPTIGLWAALLDDGMLYQKVQDFKKDKLSHSNFQFWYPDESTEDNLYKNSDTHGTAFSEVPIEKTAEEFLKAVWEESDHFDIFEKLSCMKNDVWPLLLVACRHYRLPLPVGLTTAYREQKKAAD